MLNAVTVMNFGPLRLLSPDGSDEIAVYLWPELAAAVLLEPEPEQLSRWTRRLELKLGVTDAHRRALARAALMPFPGEAELSGHRLQDEVRPIDEHLEWYLVRTASSREQAAEDALVASGFAVYLPMMARWQRGLSRERRRVERPLFGSLMFVGMLPTQSMYLVEAIEAVHAVVRFGADRNPLTVPFGPPRPGAGCIRDILERERAGDFDKTRRDKRKDPARGAGVQIVGGPFTGFSATFVERREDERIEVLFSLFGRTSPLVLEQDQVAGMGEDSAI